VFVVSVLRISLIRDDYSSNFFFAALIYLLAELEASLFPLVFDNLVLFYLFMELFSSLAVETEFREEVFDFKRAVVVLVPPTL
jgi:hypothetical protein